MAYHVPHFIAGASRRQLTQLLLKLFTLREGGESLEQAQQLHCEREEAERERDEESNEPVTRSVSEWRADMVGLDFPFIDTVPLDEQRHRANQAADLAIAENFVERIDRDVAFQNETVRGKYWRGVELISVRRLVQSHLRCSEEDFYDHRCVSTHVPTFVPDGPPNTLSTPGYLRPT